MFFFLTVHVKTDFSTKFYKNYVFCFKKKEKKSHLALCSNVRI